MSHISIATNVTEKLALLAAIGNRVHDIKKRRLAIVHEENALADDLDRYNELIAPDFELRQDVRNQALAAHEKKKAKDDAKKAVEDRSKEESRKSSGPSKKAKKGDNASGSRE